MRGAPPQRLRKTPHDSGVCWEQFVMLLGEVLVCGGVSFHPSCTSRVDEGIRVVGAVPGLPVYCLVSSVVGGVEVRPLLGDLGRALFRQALLVRRGYPGVASWLSHEGLPKFEGGLGHELAPPGGPAPGEPIP